MANEERTIRIGTRRSGLALKQTELVVAALQAAHPNVRCEVHAVSVLGDRDKTTALPELGKGVWTTELEAKLVAGELDLIVHSLKDMPTKLPDGCVIGCVTEREDARDAVLFREPHRYTTLADLPEGAVVGTSSVRRAAQIRRRYRGLVFRDVRGNIDTRVRKLEKTDGSGSRFDCIILAAAGLARTGQEARISQRLSSRSPGGGILHAVGQGALGLECRTDDVWVRALLASLRHGDTEKACTAERSLMRTLEGGCSVPIGVETDWEMDGAGRRLRFKATVVSLDGQEAADGEISEEVDSLEEAEALGERMAAELVRNGARKILDGINKGREGRTGAVKMGESEKDSVVSA